MSNQTKKKNPDIATPTPQAGSSVGAEATQPCKPKTYAVHGLVHWVASFPAGASSITVEFTGGQLSGYGIVPATFTTADPVVQRAIEASAQWRDGRISNLPR